MDDSLVGRRSKRSTAGNRMEAALAEMSVDDLMQDVEEDIDFISKVDEEDVFESDFASTDEDEGKDDDEAGERILQDEEKRAKRAARQKTFKVPKSKPPLLKVTFGSPAPDGEEGTPSQRQKSKSQRRVSLGQVVDAETGEVLETNKRQSKREATRINTQELQSRLKTAEDRKATITKRPKEVERRKTQAELITAALDMEEDNIISHRDYLVTEEERRKKARVVKATTIGPKIRWTSRIEEVAVTVYDPVVAPHQVHRPTWTSPYAPPTNTAGQSQSKTSYVNPYNSPLGQPATSASGADNTQPNAATKHTSHTNVAASTTRPASIDAVTSISKKSGAAATPGPPTQHYTNQYYPYQYYTPSAQGQTQPYQPYGQYYTYQPQAIPPHLQLYSQGQPHGVVPRKTTEKQAKNYIEHLANEERPQVKPTWRESMDALFGTHADWDNIRVYVGKNRPIGRQIQTCPITGLQARYRDPRTGVPYANAGAFRIITRLLAHEYVWSSSAPPAAIGVFVGHEKQRGVVGVPTGWGEAMAGVEDGWRKKRVDGRREEKAKEKEKEVRVGGRRSSRIAGEAGESGDKERMDVDMIGSSKGIVDSGQNLDADPAMRES